MGKRAWIADDGTTFDTKAAMKAYEEAGPHAEIIDAYLETIEIGDMSERAELAQLTRTRNILRDFLAWQDEQDAAANGLGDVALESVAA